MLCLLQLANYLWVIIMRNFWSSFWLKFLKESTISKNLKGGLTLESVG